MNNVTMALIGSAGVGKTSLVHMLAKDKMPIGYISTIGVDVKFIETKDDHSIFKKIAIWDLAGDDRFSYMVEPFLKKCDIIGICISASDLQSLEDAKQLYDKYEHLISSKYIIVIVTKIDLIKNDFNRIEIKNFANEIDAKYIETSALERKGYKELLDMLSNMKLLNILEIDRTKKWCACLIS